MKWETSNLYVHLHLRQREVRERRTVTIIINISDENKCGMVKQEI